jgi:hypothetical protein
LPSDDRQAMKKVVLFLALLSLFLIAADNQQITRLVRLVVINKSGMPVEISLTSNTDENLSYYLRIPLGDRDAPYEMTFTIIPDQYQATAYYIEPWDPVYGYDCSSKGGMLNAESNLRVTILECDRNVRASGDTNQIKLGFGGGGHRKAVPE